MFIHKTVNKQPIHVCMYFIIGIANENLYWFKIQRKLLCLSLLFFYQINIMKSNLSCFKYYRYYESNKVSTGLALFQTVCTLHSWTQSTKG